MRFAKVTKKYYCGIDLHAKKMVVCIKNRTGKIIQHVEVDSKMDALVNNPDKKDF